MCGLFPEPPKITLTLVLEVGAHGQDGGTESVGPCLVIDVTVYRGQDTGDLVAGELVLSAVHLHTAVYPNRLSELLGRAGPVLEDVWASGEEFRFAFSR